jgi:ribosomal protein S18 acetylase RimI-like enzyme
VTVRPAESADLLDVVALDRACFPDGDPYLQPAAPGELEEGIRQGRLLVAREPAVAGAPAPLLGFIQYDSAAPDYHLILGIAVAVGHRRRGVGTRLVRAVLTLLGAGRPDAEVTVTMTTSPRNVGMLRLAFGSGFVATEYLPDYFGAGSSRFYLRTSTWWAQAFSRRTLVPVHATHLAAQLLSRPRSAVTAVHELAQGPFLEVREHRDDVAPSRTRGRRRPLGLVSMMVGVVALSLGLGFVVGRQAADLPAFGVLGAVALVASGPQIGSLLRRRGRPGSRRSAHRAPERGPG